MHEIFFLSDILFTSCYFTSTCLVLEIFSLFLPECACTTIIDISPRIFRLIYCCCVSTIIVICICPHGALIWLINLFLFLIHSYLLNNEERPECIPCNSNFSLRYVLIDCVDVADVRQTFHNANPHS